jgi:hypothetical protein
MEEHSAKLVGTLGSGIGKRYGMHSPIGPIRAQTFPAGKGRPIVVIQPISVVGVHTLLWHCWRLWLLRWGVGAGQDVVLSVVGVPIFPIAGGIADAKFEARMLRIISWDFNLKAESVVRLRCRRLIDCRTVHIAFPSIAGKANVHFLFVGNVGNLQL